MIIPQIDFNDLSSDEQDSVCDMCEKYIIMSKGVTSSFMCEGSYCERAFDMFIEDDDNMKNIIIRKQKVIRLAKLNKILN